jgi:hypothetical protein
MMCGFLPCKGEKAHQQFGIQQIPLIIGKSQPIGKAFFDPQSH